MATPHKQIGTRNRPHRERAKAEQAAAVQALNTALAPLQVEPPEWIVDAAAQDAWRELHPLLPHEVVRQCDAVYFGLTCILYEKMKRDDLSAAGMNTLLTCLDKMGLGPAGRRKLAALVPAPPSARSSRFARFEEGKTEAPAAD